MANESTLMDAIARIEADVASVIATNIVDL